ncbi:MAG: peptide chain release factor N(5)-glutamine methyltransferase [Dehalogenimonas sp.]
MNLSHLLKEADRQLSGPSAALEAEVLLRYVTGLSRAELFSRHDQSVDNKTTADYYQLIERLKNGEPLQYLTGHMEFYGLDFEVTPAVLIPRPETELMVERALNIANDYPIPAIADIGCGSGAVAIALAKNLPRAALTAIDLSPAALALAGRNAALNGCRNLEFKESDLLTNLDTLNFDIICANLPYVPTAEAKNNCFEPQLALNGGPDGLDIIRRLVSQISALQDKPAWLLLEFGTDQATGVRDIIRRFLPNSRTEIIYDLLLLERVSVTRLY